MSPGQSENPLQRELFAFARSLGFCEVGVAGLEPFDEAAGHARDALNQGRMDGMPWMHERRIESARDLRARFPWATSILALAWPYRPSAKRTEANRGRMAAYALLPDEDGPQDYHALLESRCRQIEAWLRPRAPGVRTKRMVDHSWALERAIAERAGIGFIGKHASLITRSAGSYVLLCELVLSVPLEPTPPTKRSCGHCTACMPACPTNAIVAPGVIDATRCISYLTIEHEGPIAEELRPLIGSWVFGCDLCQEACPINERLAPPTLNLDPSNAHPGPVPFPDLVTLLGISEADFDRQFARTAVHRSGRARLARNCAIALGNVGNREARGPLARSASEDPAPDVREAAAWALDRIAAGGRDELVTAAPAR